MYFSNIKKNLDMVRPKNETEYLLPSITKNCQTLIHQTHTKPQETLEFKLIKPKEIFCNQNFLLVLVLILIGWMD